MAVQDREPRRALLQRILLRVARIREAKAILVLAVLLGVFLALSLAAHSPALLHLDQAVTRALQRDRPGWLDGVARGLTFLGDTLSLLLVGIGAAVALWLWARPWAAALCAVTLLGVPLNFWLKSLVGRPRPEEPLVAVILPAIGLSFPSGHAMASLMLYGFLALMAWIHIPARPRRLFWTVLPVLIAAGIGLSRVYLGVHWFSDVLGGWTAGLFFLLILAEIYKIVGARELVPP